MSSVWSLDSFDREGSDVSGGSGNESPDASEEGEGKGAEGQYPDPDARLGQQESE